jgi:hypothetical protein
MTQRWRSALVTELRKCGEKLPASLRDCIIAEGNDRAQKTEPLTSAG